MTSITGFLHGAEHPYPWLPAACGLPAPPLSPAQAALTLPQDFRFGICSALSPHVACSSLYQFHAFVAGPFLRPRKVPLTFPHAVSLHETLNHLGATPPRGTGTTLQPTPPAVPGQVLLRGSPDCLRGSCLLLVLFLSDVETRTKVNMCHWEHLLSRQAQEGEVLRNKPSVR